MYNRIKAKTTIELLDTILKDIHRQQLARLKIFMSAQPLPLIWTVV